MSDEQQGTPVTLPEQYLPDSLLLEQASRGDALSFEQLFYRHYDRVYGILFRLVGNRADAENLTQDVFLQLYQKPPLRRREPNVGAWLYRVATNSGYNHLRGRRRLWQRNRWLVPGADRSDPQSSDGDPEQAVAQREVQAAVRQALAQLSPRQTQLLLLRQMGLDYSELAQACRVAPGSVGTLLARAGRAFRRAYEPAQEDVEDES